MSKLDFEQVMDRILYGSTQKADSRKLQKLALKLDPKKIPKSFNIPSEYIVD